MVSLLEAPQAIGALVVAIVVAIYGGIAFARKRRFQTLSAKLGASFEDTGWFAPGRVVGPDFSIDARTVGLGRYKRYRTNVRVSAPVVPGKYLVKSDFFEQFPNWKHALALGVHSERVFVTSVSFPRYREADPTERRRLLDWLSRAGALDVTRTRQLLKQCRIQEFQIEGDCLVVSFPGAVSAFERLRDTVTVLRSLARTGTRGLGD